MTIEKRTVRRRANIRKTGLEAAIIGMILLIVRRSRLHVQVEDRLLIIAYTNARVGVHLLRSQLEKLGETLCIWLEAASRATAPVMIIVRA